MIFLLMIFTTKNEFTLLRKHDLTYKLVTNKKRWSVVATDMKHYLRSVLKKNEPLKKLELKCKIDTDHFKPKFHNPIAKICSAYEIYTEHMELSLNEQMHNKLVSKISSAGL